MSLHAMKQKATTTAWESVCAMLRGAAIKSRTMPAVSCVLILLHTAAHSVELGSTTVLVVSVKLIC